MKQLALAFALLFCGASAFADSVTYSTSGFFGSTGTTTDSVGGITLTFLGAGGNVSTPTFSSLGTFTAAGTLAGTFADAFALTILQSIPSLGSGSSVTTINGTISGNSSGILLSFAPSAISIGDTTYTFSPASYGLNNPAVNGGNTTIEAYITSAPVPEPSSALLLGTGLIGLMGMAIRRKQLG